MNASNLMNAVGDYYNLILNFIFMHNVLLGPLQWSLSPSGANLVL